MKLRKIKRYLSGIRDIYSSQTGCHKRELALLQRYYSTESPRRGISQTEVVMMVDGRCLHGGLSDRIRGIVNVYSYCRTHCIPFRIHHVYPFNLTDYFEPAHIDWRIESEELSYNSNEAYPVVLQAVHLQQKLHSLYLRQTLKRHKGKQIHVYSNTVMNDKAFHDNFNHLFQPTPLLQQAIDAVPLKPHSGYVAMVFRFQQLLGDFKEGGFSTLEGAARQELIERCLQETDRLYRAHHHGKLLLVTSDSVSFLETISSRFNYVRIIPGKVVHMDFSTNETTETYLKSFVDLFLLAGADKIYLLRTGKMYRSGFGKRAARLGNIPYEEVKF